MQAWLRTHGGPGAEQRSAVQSEPLDLVEYLLGQQRNQEHDLAWEPIGRPPRPGASAAVRAYIEQNDFDIIEEGHNDQISEGVALFVKRDDQSWFDELDAIREALGLGAAPVERSMTTGSFRNGIHQMPSDLEGRECLIEIGGQRAADLGKSRYQGINVNTAMFVPTRWPKQFPCNYVPSANSDRAWIRHQDEILALIEIAEANPPDDELEIEFVGRAISGAKQVVDVGSLDSVSAGGNRRDRGPAHTAATYFQQFREFAYSGSRVGPLIRLAHHRR